MDTTASPLRSQLLGFLRHGRLITTSELRQRIRDAGFSGADVESVYRNLVALQRRGLVKRVEVRGRHAFWATTDFG
jgi:Fe2+ or Zn2+ uptake regulation protein